MFDRSFTIPLLVFCVFAAPVIYHYQKDSNQPLADAGNFLEKDTWNHQPYRSQGSNFTLPSQQSFSSPYSSQNTESSHFSQTSHSSERFPRQSSSNFPFSSSSNEAGNRIQKDAIESSRWYQGAPESLQQKEWLATGTVIPANEIDRSYAQSFGYEQLGGMTPDYGMARTLILPGNEFGPDFSAPPLENIPVWDFREIFRFDITRDWIRQRWKRVSTTPSDRNLAGMRVALVTGTNSWDLHGSLTYYFDKHQQLQRITFRGWTGDPQKLIQLLTSEFQFKSQPTQLAGFYLASHRRKTTGGMMMKYPPVLDSDVPHQQLGVVLEINRVGGMGLSDEFSLLIRGSHPD